jgi:hypothetical protein
MNDRTSEIIILSRISFPQPMKDCDQHKSHRILKSTEYSDLRDMSVTNEPTSPFSYLIRAEELESVAISPSWVRPLALLTVLFFDPHSRCGAIETKYSKCFLNGWITDVKLNSQSDICRAEITFDVRVPAGGSIHYSNLEIDVKKYLSTSYLQMRTEFSLICYNSYQLSFFSFSSFFQFFLVF